MKISDAIRNARRAYAGSFGETVRFLLTEGCLTLICLAPLLFLNSGALAPCAWAVIPLWILIMLPARMNAALAMRNALAGGKLGNRQLAETEGYGKKLACGLKRALFLLLWGAPVLVLVLGGAVAMSSLRRRKKLADGRPLTDDEKRRLDALLEE